MKIRALSLTLAAALACACLPLRAQDWVGEPARGRLAEIRRGLPSLGMPRLPLLLLRQADEPSPYLTQDAKDLTPEAQALLKDYFGKDSNWTAFKDHLASLGKRSELRLVTFGEQHGIKGNTTLVAQALEALKDQGYGIFFIEAQRDKQKAIDRYLAGEITLNELAEAGVPVLSHPGEAALEAAKRLKLEVLAMDSAEDGARGSGVRFYKDRDQEMFDLVSARLDKDPKAKAVLFTGCGHSCDRTYAKQKSQNLGKLLRQKLGSGMASVLILMDKFSTDSGRLHALMGEKGLPASRVIALKGSTIERIPFGWTDVGEGKTIQWPYADWDFMVTQPE